MFLVCMGTEMWALWCCLGNTAAGLRWIYSSAWLIRFRFENFAKVNRVQLGFWRCPRSYYGSVAESGWNPDEISSYHLARGNLRVKSEQDMSLGNNCDIWILHGLKTKDSFSGNDMNGCWTILNVVLNLRVCELIILLLPWNNIPWNSKRELSQDVRHMNMYKKPWSYIQVKHPTYIFLKLMPAVIASSLH